MRTWWALLVALAGAVLLGIFATTPPAPAGLDAPETAFSAARAMVDDRVIGRAPHPTGSVDDARVRAYLVARLRAAGLQAITTSAPMGPAAAKRLDEWRGAAAPPPALTNILAVLPGRDRTLPAVLLMAHHDSVWGSPGAADDGAGVASVLETVRAVRASGQRPRDLMVLFTDGEELGLEGAQAFFTSDPRRGHVGVIINLETRGGGGRASMFETGAGNGAMMRLFETAVARPVGTSLSVFIYQHLPNSTDYTVAQKLGYPGFNFAFIGRPGLYHSPLATPDMLDQGAVQDMGRQVLDLTRALLAAPGVPVKAPDRVFFDAFGLFLIAYPAWLGWLLLAVSASGYVAALRRKQRSSGEIWRGASIAVAIIVLSAVLLFAGNIVSGAGGKVNYYDRLAAIPRLEWQELLLCLATMALVWAWMMPARRVEAGTAVGLALPLLLLAGVAQFAAPTAAFPITTPLLLGGIAAAIGRLGNTRGGMFANMIVAMIGTGYMISLGFFLLQGVGPDTPMVVALPLALSALLVAPLIPPISRSLALKAAAVLIAVGVAIALWVRLDAVAPSVAVYSSFK
ncbi:MAG: M20/M25/M40 family metallo-hydrolase [Sphingomonas sp.]